MSLTKNEATRVAAILTRYLGRRRLMDLISELRTVKGNSSYHTTINRIEDVLRSTDPHKE